MNKNPTADLLFTKSHVYKFLVCLLKVNMKYKAYFRITSYKFIFNLKHLRLWIIVQFMKHKWKQSHNFAFL